MYFQTAYTLMPGLQCIDARRLADLQQCSAYMMDKQQRAGGFTFDPFEPIRRLAMAEKMSRNPEKPLTSFRISDILSGEAERCPKPKRRASCGHTYNTEKHGASTHSKSHSSGVISVNNTPNKKLRVEMNDSDSESVNDNLDKSPSSIVRPWNSSPKVFIRQTSEDEDRTRQKHQRRAVKINHNHSERIAVSPALSNSTNSVSSDDSFNIDPNHNLANCKRKVTLIANERHKTMAGSDSPDRYDAMSGDEEEIDVEACDDKDEDSDVSFTHSERADVSPLDALVAMSSKTFMGLESFEDRQNRENDQNGKNQMPKKKRKTRTAFTNQQIYELEKRFILQKYLTPSDRDEIAAKLGLTCAQVITWFQNRRAKFKRDIEELKNDVVATSPKRSDSS